MTFWPLSNSTNCSLSIIHHVIMCAPMLCTFLTQLFDIDQLKRRGIIKDGSICGLIAGGISRYFVVTELSLK